MSSHEIPQVHPGPAGVVGTNRADGSCIDSAQMRTFARRPTQDLRRMHSLYLLYLDRHHLGDELFLKSLAQHFSNAGTDAPTCLLVHGSGEKVERTLEAQGHFPERTDGVIDVETEDQRRLVERAVREVNQEIVAALTDEVVSTVGIQGVDRGLFRVGDDASLQAANVGWLSALLKQHVVPVVSALVEAPGSGAVREVGTEEAVRALARALDDSFDPRICVLTTAEGAGVPNEAGEVQSEVESATLEDRSIPEPAAVRRLAETDVPVLVTSLQGLFNGATPTGTRVRP